MIYSKDDIYKLLNDYFFQIESDNSLRTVILSQQQMLQEILTTFIADNKDKLYDKTKELVRLIKLLYEDGQTNIENTPVLIKQFTDKTLSYNNIGVFAKDGNLSDSLKNLYMYTIIEKIRYAKLQKDSLRDTSSYNRHIAKALTNMRDSLIVLFELGSQYDEVLGVLEKYYEFNRYVNTTKCWTEFYSLMIYLSFSRFAKAKEEEILTLYKRGNLQIEAIKRLIEDKNIYAIDALMNKLMEIAMDDLEGMNNNPSFDLSLPFDSEFLHQFCILFATNSDEKQVDTALDYFIQLDKRASDNVLHMFTCNSNRNPTYGKFITISQNELIKRNSLNYSPNYWLS